jgi:TRAP-type mannitol/chloroaromatic compound transport system permease large subunit
MVCWLFVGSWTFSSVFSYLGGEHLIEQFVEGLDLTPLQFLILAQIIIFLLGWPLEWTEIIIIFVPIFLPLLPLFGVDPLFFGILIALNLQTSFLTPPMAMSAFYLKGVAPLWPSCATAVLSMTSVGGSGSSIASTCHCPNGCKRCLSPPWMRSPRILPTRMTASGWRP